VNIFSPVLTVHCEAGRRGRSSATIYAPSACIRRSDQIRASTKWTPTSSKHHRFAHESASALRAERRARCSFRWRLQLAGKPNTSSRSTVDMLTRAWRYSGVMFGTNNIPIERGKWGAVAMANTSQMSAPSVYAAIEPSGRTSAYTSAAQVGTFNGVTIIGAPSLRTLSYRDPAEALADPCSSYGAPLTTTAPCRVPQEIR
jgi:hypothetical protein